MHRFVFWKLNLRLLSVYCTFVKVVSLLIDFTIKSKNLSEFKIFCFFLLPELNLYEAGITVMFKINFLKITIIKVYILPQIYYAENIIECYSRVKSIYPWKWYTTCADKNFPQRVNCVGAFSSRGGMKHTLGMLIRLLINDRKYPKPCDFSAFQNIFSDISLLHRTRSKSTYSDQVRKIKSKKSINLLSIFLGKRKIICTKF